jgi:hypothetical protein
MTAAFRHRLAFSPPIPADVEGLAVRLEGEAQGESEASRMMAEAKTARQVDRDDYPEMQSRGYSWSQPEETTRWRAASALRAQAAEIGVLQEVLGFIETFADVRSKDDSITFARVNRGALRTIRDKARQVIFSLNKEPDHGRG